MRLRSCRPAKPSRIPCGDRALTGPYPGGLPRFALDQLPLITWIVIIKFVARHIDYFLELAKGEQMGAETPGPIGRGGRPPRGRGAQFARRPSPVAALISAGRCCGRRGGRYYSGYGA